MNDTIKPIVFKPCPFCGAVPEVYWSNITNDYEVICDNKDCYMDVSTGEWDTTQGAIDTWNARI